MRDEMDRVLLSPLGLLMLCKLATETFKDETGRCVCVKSFPVSPLEGLVCLFLV